MTLRWHITVAKAAGRVPAGLSAAEAARHGPKSGTKLVMWRAPLDGVASLESLVQSGRGALLSDGAGYPNDFQISAADVREALSGQSEIDGGGLNRSMAKRGSWS